MDTLFTGQNYIFLPETPSTNTYISTLLKSQRLAEGTVVSAGFQTAGRGQAGNTWDAAQDENIVLSVLFYPRFIDVAAQFMLSKAIALAVYDFISGLLPDKQVSIKWPNDILVSGAKICGILIENGLKGSRIETCIAGIGININQVFHENKRTSLKTLTGLDYDLRYLEKLLFKAFEVRYLKLKSDPDAISKDYLRALYGLGIPMKFRDNIKNEDFEGIISGINADGRLKMDIDGEERLFSLKEISLL